MYGMLDGLFHVFEAARHGLGEVEERVAKAEEREEEDQCGDEKSALEESDVSVDFGVGERAEPELEVREQGALEHGASIQAPCYTRGMFTEESQHILQRLMDQLKQIRTGRANPSLIDSTPVLIEAYGGARMPLRDVASIVTSDANLLVVAPFDPSTLRDVEKSIALNDMGLTATIHDKVIHVVVPSLTQERRLQFVKMVKERGEETRVALRNLRTDVKEMIEAEKGKPGVSEDDIKRQVTDLQKEVDAVMAKVEQMLGKKEEELKQI